MRTWDVRVPIRIGYFWCICEPQTPIKENYFTIIYVLCCYFICSRKANFYMFIGIKIMYSALPPFFFFFSFFFFFFFFSFFFLCLLVVVLLLLLLFLLLLHLLLLRYRSRCRLILFFVLQLLLLLLLLFLFLFFFLFFFFFWRRALSRQLVSSHVMLWCHDMRDP